MFPSFMIQQIRNKIFDCEMLTLDILGKPCKFSFISKYPTKNSYSLLNKEHDIIASGENEIINYLNKYIDNLNKLAQQTRKVYLPLNDHIK